MSLSKNLKHFRKIKNISQRELAEQTNVTPAYIALLETGDRTNPSYSVLKKLSKALDVPISVLLQNENS